MSMKLMITAAALAALAAPALAANHSVPRDSFAQAPGAQGAMSQTFDGWPADYLINRFGDQQLQGR